MDDALQSDDRLLSSLQKLGWELDQQDPEEKQSVEKLREICMRYAVPGCIHHVMGLFFC